MNYISTRNNQINFSSEEVLNYGLAPDGGLFIPKEIPKFSIGDIKNLKNQSNTNKTKAQMYCKLQYNRPFGHLQTRSC